MSLEELEKNLYNLGDKKEVTKEAAETLRSKEKEEQLAPPENKQIVKPREISDKVYKVYQMEKPSFFDKVALFSKTIFWLVILALVISGSIAGYFLSQYLKVKDFVFDVNAPSKIFAGQPFEITINIENKSKNQMRDSIIDIQLPNGVVGLGKYSDRQVIGERIGNLETGDSDERKFLLAILDTSEPRKKIDIYFSYRPPNLDTKFEKKKTIEIFSDRPAISLNLSVPQKVFSGEQFETTIDYKNFSDFNFSKVQLKLFYPNGFNFKEATLATSSGNSIWSVQMPQGAENNLAVKGSIVGPEGTFYDLKAKIFVELEGKEYQLLEKTASFSIASAPLSLTIIPNNDPNYVAALGDIISYRIVFRNNTDVNLQDAVIKAKISGAMFDLASYQGAGFFDSVNNTIIWNASQAPELKNIVPNFEGAVTFSFKVKQNYPIKKLSDKNFSLRVQGEISSPTVPYYIASDKTVGLANSEVKIGGQTEIASTAAYNKKGPYPPQLNKSTRYLVRWVIKNYATDIKDIKITATLQSGATWTNIVTTNVDAGAVPIYNERTQEVTWDIARIIANKGVIGKPVEATFEVEISPSISQVGSPLPILSETQMLATDEFSGRPIKTTAPPFQTFDVVEQRD